MIYLIGFMGSGKTYFGRKLAERMKWEFMDTDDQIEKIVQKTITRIFQTEGEYSFRIRERNILRSIVPAENKIIACGGGTPCFFENMKWMKDSGKVVFLDVIPDILYPRLIHEKASKPLLCYKSDSEIRSYIHSTLHTRLSYYRQADYIITVNHTNTENIILDQLSEIARTSDKTANKEIA